MNLHTDILAWLVDPHACDDFLADILGQQPLHCQHPDRTRFDNLLSLAQLDLTLGTFGLRFPDVKLVKLDEDIPAAQYTWGDSLVDPMRVARLFSEGATVIFGALHDRHEHVRQLCARLSAQANARTQANIYLTPPTAQGFKPHWDTHDVFVLQIEGSKRWRLYDGGLTSPLSTQKFNPSLHEPGPLTSEFTLHAGEVLYIPRGVMHAAASTEATSLHITLGLIAYTWAELLTDCVAELAERDPQWRQSVPFGFAQPVHNGTKPIAQLTAEKMSDAAKTIDVDAVIRERLQHIGGSHRPRVADHLQQAIAASSLNPNDVVRKRPDLPSRMETRGDRVIVTAGKREIDFPANASQTIKAVLSEQPVRVADIVDDLDWPGKKTVISTLVREGILANLNNSSHTIQGDT